MLHNPQNTIAGLSVFDAIYSRRSVRKFTNDQVDPDMIDELLDAAIQAPCAMHEELCAFVVIQDPVILSELSKEIKNQIKLHDVAHSSFSRHATDIVNNEKFEVFYGANTLIIICSQFDRKFTSADCWLAAENLMLAALGKDLGTCVIGFAIDTLNTAQWKRKLNIPADAKVIAPIIVGKPTGTIQTVSRKPPLIYSWKALALSS